MKKKTEKKLILTYVCRQYILGGSFPFAEFVFDEASFNGFPVTSKIKKFGNLTGEQVGKVIDSKYDKGTGAFIVSMEITNTDVMKELKNQGGV